MGSIPAMDEDRERLLQIDGAMPRLNAIPRGCAFNPRCPQVFERCRIERPELLRAGATRAACWLHRTHGRRARMTARWSRSRPGARPSTSRRPGSTASSSASRASSCMRSTASASRIARGKTLALVGESGCGKSTVARLLVGPVRADARQRRLRRPGHRAAQLGRRPARPAPAHADDLPGPVREPESALEGAGHRRRAAARARPVHGRRRRDARSEVGELLQSVGLAAADAEKFPHQFSGGQRQRISIARALATQPEFLVCDEPTSALDVSVQAQVLNIMKDLQRQQGLTYLFISHNLAVVRHVSDAVGVMYLGRLVELADKAELFARPRHPYTRMLLDAIPDIHMSGRARTPVQGEVPNPLNPPSGCAFHPRCPHANARCAAERPALLDDRGRPRGLPRGRGRAGSEPVARHWRIDATAARRASTRQTSGQQSLAAIRSAMRSRSRISTGRPSTVTRRRGRGCCSCWPCHRVGAGRQHGEHVARLHAPARGRGRASRPIRRPGRRRPRLAAAVALRAGDDAPSRPGTSPGASGRSSPHRRCRSSCCAPGFRYSTSVSSTPALPTSERPGSNRSSRWPWPRASMRCEQRAHQVVGARRRLVGVGDAQAAAEVEVLDRDALGLDRLDQIEQAVERIEIGCDLR